MTRLTLDANVFVYAADRRDRRHQAARLIIATAAETADAVLTIQAMGEFFHVATRKRLATHQEAIELVEQWLTVFPLALPAGPAQLAAAMSASAAGRFGFWDAVLLATAEAAGCTAVISEDMGHGATLGGVTVIRAFQDSAVSPEAAALLR